MSETLALFRNILWLLISFILALFIWIFASFQRDPIVQRSYIQVPIEFRNPENLLFLDEPRRTATIFIRAPESEFSRFTRDEITLFTDLQGLEIGNHLVNLQVEIANQHLVSVADISPNQILVSLDRETFREQAIQVEFLGELLPGFYFRGYSILETENATVYGPTSELDAVSKIEASLLLSGQRNSFQEIVNLSATDSEGEIISSLRIVPEQVTINVEVSIRDDVHQIAVHQPPLDFSSLPWGYYPSSIRYEPQFIFVSGTPEQLASLPEYLSTESVDLSNRTEDFEIDVPIILPAGLEIVDDTKSILVNIGIEAQEGYREFEELDVDVVGLLDGVYASLNPNKVSVYLAGPLPILRTIDEDLIIVQVDVSDMTLGFHSKPPRVVLPNHSSDFTSLSVVPAFLEIELKTSNEN